MNVLRGNHIERGARRDFSMYEWIHELLKDRKGGEIFRLFSGWHFFYIGLSLAVVLLVFFLIRKKEPEKRMKAAGAFSDAAFFLYMADFFLMPFAYEEIDIEKLPFHICTAMCVACFVCRHVSRLEKWRMPVTLLGFLSNLVYLIYPAGVMWHAVHPLSYRVVQTLLFHSLMTIYGALAILTDPERLSFRKWHRYLLVIVFMTLWAVLGNLLYTGSAGKYTGGFNWFFVTGDPFGMMDRSIAPFVMPFVNIAVFFLVEMGIVGLVSLCDRRKHEE